MVAARLVRWKTASIRPASRRLPIVLRFCLRDGIVSPECIVDIVPHGAVVFRDDQGDPLGIDLSRYDLPRGLSCLMIRLRKRRRVRLRANRCCWRRPPGMERLRSVMLDRASHRDPTRRRTALSPSFLSAGFRIGYAGSLNPLISEGLLLMENAESQTDLDLIRRARVGEWEAFETLVNRLEPRVFALSMRLLRQRQDAEDATQQTFLKVMESLDSFREEASVATWVLRIATNHALTMLRKRRPDQTVRLDVASSSDGSETPLPHPQYVAQWKDDPSELAQRSEVRQLLEEALGELDEKYRVVFTLRDVEQFSTRETAEIIGISESNVKVRLLRARLQLRERLTGKLGMKRPGSNRPNMTIRDVTAAGAVLRQMNSPSPQNHPDSIRQGDAPIGQTGSWKNCVTEKGVRRSIRLYNLRATEYELR